MANGIKYQTHEVLNKVLNSGEDALNVDIDNVTLTTEGGDVAIDVALDKANDSVTIYANTAADGSGDSTVPLVDAAGNLQIDIVSSALPSGGATAANQSTIIGHVDGVETLLGTIDADTNAIKTAVEAVNQAAEGTISATTQRVTIATDDDGVAHLATIAGAVSTQMQVDVVAALPAGSNAIGKLAANSGVDIGDVDILSIAAGDNNIGNVDIVSLHASTNTIEIVGDAAEDAAVAGNPVLSGGRYDTPGNDNASVRSLDNGDVGAIALDPTGALYVREHLGQAGSCFVSGVAALTAAYGKFVAIQFLEDTVFHGTAGLVATDSGRWPDDTDAASDVSSSNTAAVGSQSFPQGMTIFGRWDSFKLVSGAVIAYIGNV